MNSEDPDLSHSVISLWPIVWPLVGGLGGAIVSLGLAKNQALTARQKAFNVVSGTIVAVFLGPLVVRWLLGPVKADTEIVGAIYCLVGLSATSVIEKIVAKILEWIDKLPSPRKESEQ